MKITFKKLNIIIVVSTATDDTGLNQILMNKTSNTHNSYLGL